MTDMTTTLKCKMNNLEEKIRRKRQNIIMILPSLVWLPVAMLWFVFRKLASRGKIPTDVKIVRIFRSAALGDVVLTTSAIEAVKRSYPEACLEFIVGGQYASILEHNGQITKLWAIETGGLWKIVWKNKNIIRHLVKDRSDILLGLETSLSAAVFGWATMPRSHVGDKWGLQRYFYDKTASCKAGQSHLINMSLICREAGIDYPIEKWKTKICLDSGEKEQAELMLGRAGYNGGIILAIHPGGGNIHSPEVKKNWPAIRYARVLSLLNQKFKFTTLLLSGPGEEDLARTIKAEYKGKLIDLSGQTTIRQLAALIACSDLFLGNDSAPGHMAVALNVPSVTIWGSSDPNEYGIGSPSLHHRVYAQGLGCRPCRRPNCIKLQSHKWKCLSDITEKTVVDSLISLINEMGL